MYAFNRFGEIVVGVDVESTHEMAKLAIKWNRKHAKKDRWVIASIATNRDGKDRVSCELQGEP